MIVFVSIFFFVFIYPFSSREIRIREACRMDSLTVASVFALAAVAKSSHTIMMHLKHYTQPRYQLYICRILMIVPLYAFQAWLSLIFTDYAPFFSALRDVYEGYVIYMFFTLLIAYLGGEDCLIDYLELKSHMAHPGLLRRCCSRITLGRKFLRRIKQGTKRSRREMISHSNY